VRELQGIPIYLQKRALAVHNSKKEALQEIAKRSNAQVCYVLDI
jgi:hypothetical protein